MFKICAKLIVLTVAMLGVASTFSTAQASAETCPQGIGYGFAGAHVPPGYGYDGGEQLDGFGGLVVASSVGTMTNGQPDSKGRGGNPIDAKYNLRSYLPNAPAGMEYHLEGNPQGDRIFTVDGANQPVGRDSQRWFGTNGSTGDRLYGAGASFTCPGWDAIGPGRAGQIGNRHALDCGEAYYPTNNPTVRAGDTSTRFWISDIPSPNGESGQWQVIVYDEYGGAKHNFNFTPGSMGPNPLTDRNFTVKNGDTIRINLIWHAEPPLPPDTRSECNFLDVTDGGTYRRPSDGKVFASGDVRTKVRVVDSGGHALVHADGNPNGYIYLNNESRSWSYTPKGRHVYVAVEREYRSSSGVWNPWEGGAGNNSRNHNNCYSATCSISVAGNVAGKPRGVKKDSIIAVTISVTNTGRLHLPDQLAGRQFVFVSDGGQTPGLQGLNALLPTIGTSRTHSQTLLIRAPSNVNKYHFSGSAVYPGLFYPEDLNCGYDIDLYQDFQVGLTGDATLAPSDENPESATYNTNVNVSPGSPQVYVPTSSTFYKRPATGGQINLASSGGGIYPGAQWSGTYTVPPGSFAAGDEYCASVYAGYTSGWIGPNGPYDVAETAGAANSTADCSKVRNKPYFKVYGSGVSAGDAVSQPDGSCSATAANSGLLAGWNDNLDYGADRGSGAQLSTLARLKITGVASAQTDIGRSPTDLTFANTNSGDITSDRASPSLGGRFGGTPECTPPPVAKDAAALATGSVFIGAPPLNTTGKGNYKYTGNMAINGGIVGSDTATALYVDGNVYIRNNITYNTAGWSPGSASSFVLVATGNIYIDPGVTRLDGVYVAQPRTSSSGGTVYTCGTAAFQVNNDFNACKNQLLVNGSFKANKIKMLRTFGSLRDEKPNPPVIGAQIGFVWSCGGGECKPDTGNYKCTQITESKEPVSHTWQDNQLCVPKNSPVQLIWSDEGDKFGAGSTCIIKPGATRSNQLRCTIAGVTGYCTLWNPTNNANEPDKDGWNDNYLCTLNDAGLNFQKNSDASQHCTRIVEPSDPDGNWSNGNYLCEPLASSTPATSKAPFTTCSNAGTQVTTATCAAEIFQFSPELYLSDPAPDPPSKTAPQFDAITSLPPVL